MVNTEYIGIEQQAELKLVAAQLAGPPGKENSANREVECIMQLSE